MNEIIGIRSILGFNLESLKKDLLLFDKVHVDGLKQILPGYDFKAQKKIVKMYSDVILDLHYSGIKIGFEKEESKHILNEIEWLVDQGRIILNYEDIIYGRPLKKDINSYTNDLMKISDYFLKVSGEWFEKKNVPANFIEMTHEVNIRQKNCFFNSRQSIEAYPVLNKLELPYDIPSKKLDVIKILIKNIPTLDKNTPWADLFQFKEDEDTKHKFLALRNWISDISSANLSENEIEEKIEYSFREYERHLELNKMKYERSFLETVIVSGSELLENLVKLKLGKIVKMFFDFNQLEINILESELKAPGKEIAYIDKIKREFVRSFD